MRILFLTHRLPYAPNRGDRVRSHQLLRTLAAQAEVELVSLVHDRDEESRADDVRPLVTHLTTLRVPRLRNRVRALGALVDRSPLTHVLLNAPGMTATLTNIMATRPPDLVLAYCSSMARFALESPLAGVPLVLDMVDLDSGKWTDLARTQGRPRNWIYAREARCLARFEAKAVRHARATLVVNERERDNVLELVPDAKVHVVPLGVELQSLRPPTDGAENARVVFCGVMNYRPNEEAALWLAREVWPLVRLRRPDARLLLLGANPSRAVRGLPATDPTVEVTGSVPDVRPGLWRSAVSAAPLFIARGVQTKVLEAVAAGLPAVVTPAVFAGLPPEVMPACSIAETAPAFAGALLDLLGRSAAERRAIVGRANMAALGWPGTLSGLLPLLHEALIG
jgi:sugar transferase (PEP-CTERM/EpsH1 system associated)